MVSHLSTHMVCMLPSLASHTPRLCTTQKQAQHQLHASPFCSLARSASSSRWFRQRQRVVKAEMQLDNRELLVGDCLSLVSFCLYKQITAIILTPSFPGWLAPMHFNPTRFEEFLSFAITVCGTWVGASWLVGGYKANATSGDPTFFADTPLCYLNTAPIPLQLSVCCAYSMQIHFCCSACTCGI
ncbi:hypothetical protein ABBQ38_002615 [Trebouxia sp. C0009 RCD-2024]